MNGRSRKGMKNKMGGERRFRGIARIVSSIVDAIEQD